MLLNILLNTSSQSAFIRSGFFSGIVPESSPRTVSWLNRCNLVSPRFKTAIGLRSSIARLIRRNAENTSSDDPTTRTPSQFSIFAATVSTHRYIASLRFLPHTLLFPLKIAEQYPRRTLRLVCKLRHTRCTAELRTTEDITTQQSTQYSGELSCRYPAYLRGVHVPNVYIPIRTRLGASFHNWGCADVTIFLVEFL